MANQPSKYKKFVVTAASAALVASAVAPVAFAAESNFTDIGGYAQETQDQINSLVAAGIISGTTATTFSPTTDITRGQVVKLLGRYLVESGKATVPADWNSKERFSDLPANFVDTDLVKNAAVVFDAGVFKGNEGVLNTSGKITRENMALVLDRAAKAITGASLVELAAGKTSNVTDIANAKTEAQAAIKAVNALGVSTVAEFKPKNNVQRVHFATFLSNSIEVIAGLTQAPAIKSVMATNAKTIEVAFNTAVDTEKAKVELLRGTFKQNVTLKWADDKKSVELIGAGNFQAADYTVNVTGLGDKTLTGSVKIEAVKIASIEILDDVAVVSKGAVDGKFDGETTATVGYIVKDQYGVDISKTASLKTNDDVNISLKDGVITLGAGLVQGKTVGSLVPVVLIDTNTGISTTKVVKLSAESTVSEIAVSGVYNAKGEVVELNDKSKASEAFIVVDLKDQYGKEITSAMKAAGLVITNTNTNNLELNTKVTSKKIGKDDKLVIEIQSIKKSGDTDVLLISTTNGKSAKYTVKVAETETADGITVGQPEVAVEKEETLIPVTVTDKAGNVITDVKLLANKDKGIKVGGKDIADTDLIVKDGQVFYKMTFDTKGTQALVFQTSTYKVATITVDVKAVAKATAVRGLKNPLVIKAGADDAKTVTAKDHLIIEDQYGRVMKDASDEVVVALVGESDVVKVTGTNVVTGLKNGTATLNIKLTTENGTISSAVEVKVQVTDGKEYKSYEVKDLGLLNSKKVDGNALTVSGVLADGGKVALTGADYSTTTNVDGVTVENGVLTVDQDKDTAIFKVDGKTVTEREVKVSFTINNDGTKVEHTYKISNAEAKVQDFFFTSSDAVKDAKVITELDRKEGTFTLADTKVVTTDQYGVKAHAAGNAVSGLVSITIVPADASKVEITGNGTKTAEVTANADTTVTALVKIGNATKELKVVLKATPQ